LAIDLLNRDPNKFSVRDS